MALFLEYSDKVKNRKYPITKPVRQHASALYNALEKLVPKNNLKGLKDLATLKKYNVKGANSDKNGEDTNIKYITTDDAIKRLQRKGYGIGDTFIQNFLKKCVDKSTSQEEVSPVEPPKPASNEVKPPQVKTKTINGSNGTVTYTENKIIKESSDEDWPIYYDYLTDYDAYYVLSEFFNNPQGKQNWGALINPSMYKKALSEFTKYGKLINFPSKYVYQWMGIIMKNTAILRANTDLAGHSSQFPSYEVAEFAENIDGIEIEPDYGEGSEWLWKKGLYKWMQMPDGSDAWSDYGLDPLETIFAEYNEDLPPEKVLVLVNRALDVYHQRGDMASIFIQGGSRALSAISEEIKRNSKKIYLSEQAIKKLYEYYTQLNLPFNDTSGKGYDDKLNYEHFVDWLEYYGKYGQLEDSGIKEDDIQETFVDNNIASAFKYFFRNESEDGYFIEDIGEALRNLYYTASVDEDYLRLYFAFDEETYENPPEDIGEYIEDIGFNIEDIDDVESILTDEGIEKLRGLLEAEFKNRIIDNGVPYSFEINDRGLIYIEREITMPNVMSPNVPREAKNYFEYLIGNNFNGVGQCWTFMKGKGEAYCGVGYGGGTDYILLQGWVDPRSINWQETLMRNAWSMNEEHEIFINSGYLVEIDKITLNRTSNSNYGKNILSKPILIQT